MDNKLTRKQRINAVWMGAASLLVSTLLFIASQHTSDADGVEPGTSNGLKLIDGSILELSDNIGYYEYFFMVGGGVAAVFALICFIVAATGRNPG